MKASREIVYALAQAIGPLDTAEARESARAAGMSDMRYRWTLYWKAHDITLRAARELDRYADSPLRVPDTLNDRHWDTALRAVVLPLAS